MLDDDGPRSEPILRSTALVTVSSLGVKGLALARMLVAARLLEPTEFGRFALVIAILGVVEAVAQPGISAALQQVPNPTRATYRTAFTVLLGRGMVLGVATVALASPAATAFRQPDADRLLTLAALAFVARGLSSTRMLERAREVDLMPYAASTAIGAIAETIFAVAALATGHRNAGVLVLAFVVGTAAESLSSWVIAGLPHGLGWSRAEVRRLLPVSRWIFASSVLEYLSTTGDDLVVARRLGAGDLGVYRVSYRIASLPTTEISHTVGRVALPALSRRAERSHDEVRSAHTSTVIVVGGLAAAVAAVLCAVSSPLVEAVLGDAWRDAVDLLVILAIAGWLRAVVATSGPLFTGVGRPALATAILAVRAAVLGVGLLVLIGPYGVEGAAFASLLSVALMFVPWLWGLQRVGLDAIEVLRGVAARIPLAALVGAATFASTLPFTNPVLDLALAAPASIGAWALASRVLDPTLHQLLVTTIRQPRSQQR